MQSQNYREVNQARGVYCSQFGRHWIGCRSTPGGAAVPRLWLYYWFRGCFQLIGRSIFIGTEPWSKNGRMVRELARVRRLKMKEINNRSIVSYSWYIYIFISFTFYPKLVFSIIRNSIDVASTSSHSSASSFLQLMPPVELTANRQKQTNKLKVSQVALNGLSLHPRPCALCALCPSSFALALLLSRTFCDLGHKG